MYNSKYTAGSIKIAMEKDGEMSKLRASSGIRISSSPAVSTYILEKKIRVILEHYAQTQPHTELTRIHRMLTKLDKLQKVDLEYLHFLGTQESVSDMIEALKMTHSNINKLATQWKSADETLNEE
jgi:hypothetical protein